MVSTSYSALSRPWPLPVPKLGGRVASVAAAVLRRRWVVTARISESRLRAFQHDFTGKVIRPDDPDYERARSVWNGAINRRPALIARCSGPADVVQAIRFGRYQALDISVRGGVHFCAVSAVCDDGLMIDLIAMRQVMVVSSTRRSVV